MFSRSVTFLTLLVSSWILPSVTTVLRCRCIFNPTESPLGNPGLDSLCESIEVEQRMEIDHYFESFNGEIRIGEVTKAKIGRLRIVGLQVSVECECEGKK